MEATTPLAAPARTRSLGSRLLWLARRAAIVYCGVLLVLLLLENMLVYHPSPAEPNWKPPVGEEVFLTASDGTRIHSLWCERLGSDLALLYCHGNGGNLQYRTDAIRGLSDALGVSVLIFDYPGYGRSEGKPTEAGCYAAADAAYDWLAQKVKPERIILYGKSLGGGVAVDLATRRAHHSLVLMKTFTSAPDLGQATFPWIPARLVMQNRFDNLAKISQCSRPIFVAHGDRDEIIPLSFGQRLYEAAPTPKQFYLMAGSGHNDPIPAKALAALGDFLGTVK